MQKITTLLCVVCLALVAQSAVAGFKLADDKITIGLNARIRYEFFNNTDFTTTTNDTRDYFLTRLRPTFSFLPHEQVEVVFEPQFTGGWGEILGTSQTSVNAASAASSSGNLDDPTLGVHQGYLKYKPTDWYEMTLGRQVLAYGDQVLIGAVDWNNTGRSFDAFKSRFSGENFWIDAVYTLLSDTESSAGRGACAAPCTFGDHHFGGVYASINAAEWLKELDFYAFYRFDSVGQPPRAHNYAIAGTRLKGATGIFDYRFETTAEYGKSTISGANNNQRDWQTDAELGVTFKEAANFRIGVEALAASKNFIQMFPTAHKWLGYVDLFGRRNIMSGVLRLSAKPSEKWLMTLDAHTIMRYSNTLGLYALNGTTAIGAVGTSTSKFGGEEIDLTASFKPLDILSFDMGLGTFLPMGFVKTNVGNDPTLFGYLQTGVRF
ncbi:MAG: alginate export family protein [Deltaproteobacteria bacterium]|nr:alginate export family protein [Deltaproteobacteria bacterium]